MHVAMYPKQNTLLSPCGSWINIASVAVRPNQAIIAFAGSSPPSPLRHVAAGLGGHPGEGKDFLERGDWQQRMRGLRLAFQISDLVVWAVCVFPNWHCNLCYSLVRDYAKRT